MLRRTLRERSIEAGTADRRRGSSRNLAIAFRIDLLRTRVVCEAKVKASEKEGKSSRDRKNLRQLKL